MAPDPYTHDHSAPVLRAYSWRSAENSAPHLLPLLRPGQRLLDVGCGLGSITLDLARRVAPGEVVGIDVAEDALAHARADAAEQGVDDVAFTTGDVYALDAEDDSFDVVHAHQVLQHLSDPVAALAEMRRVCRPGGVVAARDADYAAMTWFPVTPGLERWLELYHQLARANGGEPDAGRRLLGWARAAGFTDVTATASTWCFATPEDRAWWGGTWAERVRATAFARQALERGLATEAELEQLSQAWQEWSRAEDGWFAVLHGEVLARA